MTATLIEQVPIDVTDDLTRAREVVAQARSDARVALVAHTELLTVETLAQQVQQAEEALRRERDEWTDWVRHAVERSQEVANDNDWCGVYDATMERLGLPPRTPPEPEEEEVGWRATVTLRRTVDDDDVIHAVTTEDMRRRYDIEVDEAAVLSVQITVSGEITVEEGSCVCDTVDSDDIVNNLPDDFSDWEYENRRDLRCDND